MKKHILIFLKGMAMGTADVVPGVSGGTIAFITGIYDKLLQSINRINIQLISKLKKEGIKATWSFINGSFLVALFMGIGISIIMFASFFKWLLLNYPIYLWAFFFGLIIACLVFMLKFVKDKKSFRNIALFIVFSVASFFITTLEANVYAGSNWYLFLCGMIAIIAMVLPGISGSFILLLLGAYRIILGYVDGLRTSFINKDWELFYFFCSKIFFFAIGAIIGLKTFAKLLAWLLEKHRESTIVSLIGVMFGSLNKIWPWKITIKSTYINDKLVILSEKNSLPNDISEVLVTLVFCILGYILVNRLEKVKS